MVGCHTMGCQIPGMSRMWAVPPVPDQGNWASFPCPLVFRSVHKNTNIIIIHVIIIYHWKIAVIYVNYLSSSAWCIGYLKYRTSSGLFPYIGLSKPCDGPTFSGPPNRKPNEGGTSTRGFRKFGFLKLILSKTLNPNSSVGLKCKTNHMLKVANKLIQAINWTYSIYTVLGFFIIMYATCKSLHQDASKNIWNTHEF